MSLGRYLLIAFVACLQTGAHALLGDTEGARYIGVGWFTFMLGLALRPALGREGSRTSPPQETEG